MLVKNSIPSGSDAKIISESLWRIRLNLVQQAWKNNWQIFTEKKIGLVGLWIIGFFILLAISHPILMAYWSSQELSPEAMMGHNKSLADVYDPIRGLDLRPGKDMMPLSHPAAPSWQHPFGTDPMGRDVLSQIMYSTRIEFLFGVFSALLSVLLATLVGAVSAYFGGKIDAFFMRLADLVLTLPFLPFLIFLSSLLTLDLFKLGLVLGLLGGFGGRTIVLKSQALSIKVRPYIEAAKIAGGSHWHIIFRHIIPNILPLSFFYLMLGVTSAVMSEATLSFLGLLQAPISWGLIMNFARSFGYSFYEAWWLYLIPGVTITLFCGSFYLVGRGLDTLVNPKLRKR